jgi:hypothetical protein
MKIMERRLVTWIEDSYQQHTCPDAVHPFEGVDVSPIRIEITILAKEIGFHDIGEDNVAEILELNFLPLTIEELAEIDK